MHDLVYIAGPFFSDQQKAVIENLEDMLDDRELKYFSPREYGVILDVPMSPQRHQRIFDMNIRMIKEANTMIAVTDDFDPGTMFELGAFYQQQKLYGFEDTMLVTYSPQGYGANVMIAQATFGHARNLEELGHALNGHAISGLEATE